MMHKIFITVFAGCLATSVMAGPAKRIQKTLTQPDGTTIVARFGGDEYQHFYTDAQGNRLKQDEQGVWRVMTSDEVTLQNRRWRQIRASQSADTKSTAASIPTKGEHHLLTILVQFPDLKFSEVGSKANFENLLNGEAYRDHGATGSAKQYFMDQSSNEYIPTFDIIGPVTLDKSYTYYGANDNNGKDMHRQEMAAEAIQKAVKENLISDFSPYDGDGNGYVDLVYFFYAGYSESSTGISDYIWPHQWALATTLTYGDTKLSRYACSSELGNNSLDTAPELDAIGSCVHEFGHCLGLPDFYNTGTEKGCYGMDYWSVMDQGCYNNGGKTPTGYTAYERACLGWLTLDTLPATGDVVLQPLSSSNKAYVYVNPANSNEFFTFENHQPDESWDAYYGCYKQHGLTIIHVDYDEIIWHNNSVNNDPNHQHCTIVPADGTLYSYDTIPAGDDGYNWYISFKGDIWPGNTHATRFSPATKPSTAFFTGDPAPFEIYNLQETEGNICFSIRPYDSTNGIRTLLATEADAPIDVYDLRGRIVLRGVNLNTFRTSDLPHGLYLITNDTLRKIVTK